jgi:hypothetical protein
VPTPGSGSSDDAKFYIEQLGHGCSYDPQGGLFEIRVPAVEDGVAKTKSFSGHVLQGTPAVPSRIATNGAALDFMEVHGTLLELQLSGLAAGECHAIRLVVKPVELLNLPEKLGIEGSEEQSGDRRVRCPHPNGFGWRRQIHAANQSPPHRSVSATQLQS